MASILELREISKTFYRKKVPFLAVDHISLQMEKGTCLGLIGESGCGKSTTARIIAGLCKADSGTVLLAGKERSSGYRQKKGAGRVQMVFQMPQASFDPRCTIGDGIMEGMRNDGMKKKEAAAFMRELLEQVELPSEIAGRYPHEISGGQCQRAAIARALACKPDLLICDEATSALDVTVQAQIIRLLQRLQKEQNLSLLMICHDLALVQAMCSHAAVMQKGRIVEYGTAMDVIRHPREEYTKILLDAAF